ncbi:MAG: RNA 3'-phosphate cyclase [Nanoarchaeota archaeon]|nr:RNA 3'-phosphate cyclase [Nanoarchaeota archaeon]
MIEIDGNYGEGGGAILRYALALSTLTQKPFHMVNIRQGRSKPGLKPQHLFCINGLVDLCGAKIDHPDIGDKEVKFKPEIISKNALQIDIGTAGSISLLMQSFILPILFSKKKVAMKIIGGTDVPYSQPMDYFINVFIPSLEKYGDFNMWLERRGFYPKGGGILRIDIEGKYDFKSDLNIPAIQRTDRKKLRWIRGKSVATMKLIQSQVAERMRLSAKKELNGLTPHISIEAQYTPALSDGAITTLWVGYDNGNGEILPANNHKIMLGADCLGKKEISAEDVGKSAALNLKTEMDSGASTDLHLADQIIPYMGVVTSMTGNQCQIITSKITDHLRSNIYVTEKFLDVKFLISQNQVTCQKS